MSPDETKTSKSPKDKDNNQQGSGGGGGKKTCSSSSTSTTKPPHEQNMKCPRCDSPNTKFCYYNNYSLTQPRHFCKTCRRYWTKGGALRNVPIGGGCRKNKKMRPSSSSSRFSCDNSKDSASSSELVGGLKFLHSLSSPSMDFHLGTGLPFPRLQLQHQQNHHNLSPIFNQFSSFGETSSAMNHNNYPASSNSIAGSAMNFPFSVGNNNNYNGAIQGMSSMNIHSNVASSIESLSSMNQDLHWKLQQQRLSMLFGGGENQQKENNQTEKPLQPILFQNLEVTKQQDGGNFSVGNSRRESINGGDTPTEWFFGNSYGSVAATPTASGGGGGGGHDSGSNWNGGGGGGVHGWSDVQQQYSALP